MTPLASVVIPTYDRPSSLTVALRSVARVDFPRRDYEVIVVDNGPRAQAKNAVENLQEEGLCLRYVREPVPGLHNARHRGAREAGGNILVYVDDDVNVSAGWLRAIATPFDDSDVACAGGPVMALWQQCQPPEWWSLLRQDYLSLLDYGEARLELRWPQCLNGCNLAVRRSVVFEVGGFHPDAYGDARLIWFRGDGETGLLRKIYDFGYRVVYEPAARLHHCIAPDRAAADYFFWRALIEGISDSYTALRRQRSRPRSFLQGLGSYGRFAYCYCRAQRAAKENIAALCDAWYWYGKGQHQLRAALSGRLYRHVLQETYL